MGVLPTDAQVTQHLKASLALLTLPWKCPGGWERPSVKTQYM